MRGIPIVALIIMVSSAAIAQTPPPAAPSTPAPSTPAPATATPPTPPAAATTPAPDGISRDEYIQRAQDRAAKAAAKRFDAMDANHDGILTKEEMADYRADHPRKKPSPTPQ